MEKAKWYFTKPLSSLVIIGRILVCIGGVTALIQVLIGILLSHFGWLGSPVDQITWKKAGGVVLLLAGLFLSVS